MTVTKCYFALCAAPCYAPTCCRPFDENLIEWKIFELERDGNAYQLRIKIKDEWQRDLL
jgi:hypothetical protein